jgi:hypothetical protein
VIAFKTNRGEAYHFKRWCRIEKEVQADEMFDGSMNGGGFNDDGVSDDDSRGCDEEHRNNSGGDNNDDSDEDNTEYEETHNWTTQEFIENRVLFPEMTDANGNPTQAGYYLFSQTVQNELRRLTSADGKTLELVAALTMLAF